MKLVTFSGSKDLGDVEILKGVHLNLLQLRSPGPMKHGIIQWDFMDDRSSFSNFKGEFN